MSDQAVDVWSLSDLATPWCVHVVATLRIPAHIVAGKTKIGELAAAAGAHAESLARVLRHLVSKGVFTEPVPGEFALNDAAHALMDTGALLGLSLDGFGGRMAGAWSSLLSAVRTGRPAYSEVFGQPFWEDLAAHPKIAAEFNDLMGPGHGKPDPEIVIGGDWSQIRTVVDIGGGTGTMLAEILRAHPKVNGVLVDLPETVSKATEILGPAGVADRVTLSGKSFFDPLPPGADLYLLKNVLADWPDLEALALLKRCAEAARPAGRVVILGGISEHAASSELLMLVLVGGKDRSLPEFRELASRAGLKVTATGRQPSGKFLVECKPDLEA